MYIERERGRERERERSGLTPTLLWIRSRGRLSASHDALPRIAPAIYIYTYAYTYTYT